MLRIGEAYYPGEEEVNLFGLGQEKKQEFDDYYHDLWLEDMVSLETKLHQLGLMKASEVPGQAGSGLILTPSGDLLAIRAQMDQLTLPEALALMSSLTELRRRIGKNTTSYYGYLVPATPGVNDPPGYKWPSKDYKRLTELEGSFRQGLRDRINDWDFIPWGGPTRDKDNTLLWVGGIGAAAALGLGLWFASKKK